MRRKQRHYRIQLVAYDALPMVLRHSPLRLFFPYATPEPTPLAPPRAPIKRHITQLRKIHLIPALPLEDTTSKKSESRT